MLCLIWALSLLGACLIYNIFVLRRRDFEMEKLQRERDLLSHELELKAQLYQSEMNLMRQMLAGVCVSVCVCVCMCVCVCCVLCVFGVSLDTDRHTYGDAAARCTSARSVHNQLFFV